MARALARTACLAALVLFGCAFAAPRRLAVWPPETAVRVVMTPDAAAQVETLAALTRRTRREQAACVTDYAVLNVAHDSVVVGIIALGPSVPYDSDSLWVQTRSGAQFCAPGMPNVHTHVVQNAVWGRPSDYDMLQAREWSTVPFRVLVSVGPKPPALVTVYAVKP